MRSNILIAISLIILVSCGPSPEEVATQTAISANATATQKAISNQDRAGKWVFVVDPIKVTETQTNTGTIDGYFLINQTGNKISEVSLSSLNCVISIEGSGDSTVKLGHLPMKYTDPIDIGGDGGIQLPFDIFGGVTIDTSNTKTTIGHIKMGYCSFSWHAEKQIP